MVVKTTRGNVFNTSHKHIAFAVNVEGYNDAGFAGQVASKFRPELANTGGNKLGEVISFEANGKTFHALVCHSLERGGWTETPKYAEQCLNMLDVPEDETIAVVLMGAGPVGQMMGADVKAIAEAMDRSKKKLEVYSL